MDLLSIARAVWRHRIPSGIIIALTLLGCGAAAFMNPPTYEVQTYFVLLYPPPVPSSEELDRHPELRRLNSDNPFLRFTDSSVIVSIVARKMSEDRVVESLEKQGVNKTYQVAPDNKYGLSSPILGVSVSEPSEARAVTSSKIVGERLVSELRAMQAVHGTDPHYMITAYAAETPDRATPRFSSLLRSLVGILALGAFTLMFVLSAIQAIERYRAEKRAAGMPADSEATEPDPPSVANASPVVPATTPTIAPPGPDSTGQDSTADTMPDKTTATMSLEIEHEAPSPFVMGGGAWSPPGADEVPEHAMHGSSPMPASGRLRTILPGRPASASEASPVPSGTGADEDAPDPATDESAGETNPVTPHREAPPTVPLPLGHQRRETF